MSDYDKKLIEMLREEILMVDGFEDGKNKVCQSAADRIEELLAVLERISMAMNGRIEEKK